MSAVVTDRVSTVARVLDAGAGRAWEDLGGRRLGLRLEVTEPDASRPFILMLVVARGGRLQSVVPGLRAGTHVFVEGVDLQNIALPSHLVRHVFVGRPLRLGPVNRRGEQPSAHVSTGVFRTSTRTYARATR